MELKDWQKGIMENNTRELIRQVCADVERLLLEKNESYGDSALNPLGIFSDSDALVNLGARIDDKLARIKTMGFTGYGEDNVKDLTGYLILLQVELLKRK